MGKLRPQHLVELLAVLVAAFLVGKYFWRIGGQVEGTDALLYLDVALRRAESSYILNRYSHVFLLTLFLSTSGSPLQAVQLFSGVVGGVTAALVYAGGRLFSSTSGPWNGVLALASFLSLTSVLTLFTRPEVDTSAMMMGVCFTVAYVISARGHHARRWLVGLLGTLFLLSLKTKETALVAVVVFPGLGMDEFGSFRWRSFRRNLGPLILGVLLGLGLIALLNSVVLGEALFGLRPSDYLEPLSIAQGAYSLLPEPGSWFTQYLFPSVGAIFLFYVISGLTSWEKVPPETRILWLIPIGQVIFLTLTLIWSTWGVVPRYFGFSLGIMCILAAQLFGPHSAWRLVSRASIAYLLLALATVGSLGLLGLLLRPTSPFPTYYAAVLGPVALALVLGLFLIEGPTSHRIQPAVLLCALVLTVYPARVSLGAEETRLNRASPNSRFDPLSVFSPAVDANDLTSVFVSQTMAGLLRVKDRNEIAAVFNIVFDARTERDSFAIGEADRDLRRSMEAGAYHLVLLTSNEWAAMLAGGEATPGWSSGYDEAEDRTGRVVLLSSRR